VHRVLLLLGFVALSIAGCGSAGREAGVAPDVAYRQLEGQLVKGDPAACDSMTAEFRNKLAASVQLFSADCPAVVKEVGKGFREDPELRTKSIDKVRVSKGAATLIAHSTYRGVDVRTKVEMKRDPGGEWVVDRDHELDDVAPSAPLTAYREYSRAFNEGDGPKACRLSTARGQQLIAQSIPNSHGGGKCAGAVPFLAVAASKLPAADVVGGEQNGDTGTLYTLQSNGAGAWVFREVVLKLVAGAWRFDHSTDLGVAPPPRAPGGPVA
jgi:hypothetical protein